MLPRRMQDLFLYEDDSTTGTATDTQPNKTGQAEPAKLFTQDDLDKHVGSARKAGREAALKALLEELGLDSPDVLKTLVKSKKEEEEAKKSEEQKLRDALAQKDAEIAAEKKARAEAEALRLQDRRDSALKALLLSAHDPDGVLILLKAKHADKVNGLILDNGDIDSKAAETLVAEYKTNNAFQFKGDSKGSPSNADGRLLKPADDVRKEAAKEIKRKFNF